jgi:hypothetical protein
MTASKMTRERNRPRTFYDGKPMTFYESLHYCGCASCRAEIVQRSNTEPPHKPEFVAYLAATYPDTTPDALRTTPEATA